MNIIEHSQVFFSFPDYASNALGGLVVSVLATGHMGHSVAGSNPTEGGGFLWVVKIPSGHFLQRGSKAVGSMS
jgi:hypothetical protein